MMSVLYELFEQLTLFVSYVSNGGSFPQPLTPQEEHEFLLRSRTGDKTARDTLIERNLRLVAHIIKKYSNAGDTDDLISIGTIGLIKAVSTFDEGKGTQLATYAARCIENEILMYIRANKKFKCEVSLQMPLGVDKEGNEISLLDILGSDPDIVLDDVQTQLNLAKLYKLMSKLTSREKMVLEMRYGLRGSRSMTQREVAAILGISRSYVSRIEKKAIAHLNAEETNI